MAGAHTFCMGVGMVYESPNTLYDAESIPEWYGWFPTLPTTYGEVVGTLIAI